MTIPASATRTAPSIGSLRLENPFILAPMAGIGDPPYRRLCRQGGAGMVCAEMVSSNALHFGDEQSQRMLRTYPDEHPIAMQIFGAEPNRLAEAAKKAEAAGADVVDLNCGCPVPKITKTGAGISLLNDESHFAKCLEAMIKAVSIPVTFKTRLGFHRGENVALSFVKIGEAVGAAAVHIHARSKEDHHAGPPNREALRDIVQSVNIPVFGNGGVRCYDDARRMMEETGCAGVLIGQAAMGNPFLFEECKDAAGRNPGSPGNPKSPEPLRQRFQLFRRHAQSIVEYYGESLGVRRFRKYITAYTAGLPGSAAFRHGAVAVDTLEALFRLTDTFESSLT